MTSPEAIIKLREVVGDTKLVMLASRAPENEIHSRPLMLAEIDDHGQLCFLVDGTADWVAGLETSEPVNLSMSNGPDMTWVSISGTARLAADKATIHRLWTKEADAYFPDGLDSPNLRILEVRATSAEYWDGPSSRVGRLAMRAGALLGERKSAMGESSSIDLS